MDAILALLDAASSPAHIAPIVQSALEHPSLFSFTSLLSHPRITSLPINDPLRATVTLFACGSSHDYRSQPSLYLPLSSGALAKLHMLTLAALASRAPQHQLTYDDVAAAVGLDAGDWYAVESLVLDAWDAGLVQCKIDQEARIVRVLSAHPRDVVHMPDVVRIRDQLKAWLLTSDVALGRIDRAIVAASTS
jgi:hypothetical protein